MKLIINKKNGETPLVENAIESHETLAVMDHLIKPLSEYLEATRGATDKLFAGRSGKIIIHIDTKDNKSSNV